MFEGQLDKEDNWNAYLVEDETGEIEAHIIPVNEDHIMDFICLCEPEGTLNEQGVMVWIHNRIH